MGDWPVPALEGACEEPSGKVRCHGSPSHRRLPSARPLDKLASVIEDSEPRLSGMAALTRWTDSRRR